jgi:hypothetical protein
MDSQLTFRMNHGPTVTCHSSEKGHFIMGIEVQQQKQFVEISFMQIGLSIAEITVV